MASFHVALPQAGKQFKAQCNATGREDQDGSGTGCMYICVGASPRTHARMHGWVIAWTPYAGVMHACLGDRMDRKHTSQHDWGGTIDGSATMPFPATAIPLTGLPSLTHLHRTGAAPDGTGAAYAPRRRLHACIAAAHFCRHDCAAAARPAAASETHLKPMRVRMHAAACSPAVRRNSLRSS